MDKLFGSVSSVEGLAGIALTLAFVLILAKPVRNILTGTGDDPVVGAIRDLTKAMRDNTDAVREGVASSKQQLDEFKKNNASITTMRDRLERIWEALKDIERNTRGG